MRGTTIVASICGVVIYTALTAGIAAQPETAPRIPSGAAVFVDHTEFGQALSAATLKKKVPVVIVTDREKADFFMAEVSKTSTEGTAERVTKVLVFGAFAGSGKTVEASVNCTNHDGIVVFARNTSKSSIKSAAEDIAGKLKDHITKR